MRCLIAALLTVGFVVCSNAARNAFRFEEAELKGSSSSIAVKSTSFDLTHDLHQLAETIVTADAVECGQNLESGRIRDFRSCWSALKDIQGREVCGKEVFLELQVENDLVIGAGGNAGASGASILFTNSFVVKSADDDDMNQVGKLKALSQTKLLNECSGTPLAVTCCVAKLRDKWYILQRKIALPSALGGAVLQDGLTVTPAVADAMKQLSKAALLKSRFKLKVGSMFSKGDPSPSVQQISFDLKGPGFAKIDGKALATQKELFVKHGVLKDPGFAHWFPKGIEVESCGAKEAAYAYSRISQSLMSSGFTDYSFFGKVYEVQGDLPCLCDQAPRWPILLRARMFEKRVVLAVGIIDYFETKAWSKYNITHVMSTMKDPASYRSYFAGMWPKYFALNISDTSHLSTAKYVELIAEHTFKVGIGGMRTVTMKPGIAGITSGDDAAQKGVPDGFLQVTWCPPVPSLPFSCKAGLASCTFYVPKGKLVTRLEQRCG
eukprot:TRINITY_DN66201_c0_g1_i1.p1 TRINITY_DN66201_c0_g1~~TRINITY_DN66201_c0_g1_i1.p1  ORF type:complete len:493 (+),score=44.38 TRINITY_DN66201_c0_g1_i1:63-1541(+)